jgi:hypothetical protein
VDFTQIWREIIVIFERTHNAVNWRAFFKMITSAFKYLRRWKAYFDVECDAVQSVTTLPTFQRNVIPPFAGRSAILAFLVKESRNHEHLKELVYPAVRNVL